VRVGVRVGVRLGVKVRVGVRVAMRLGSCHTVTSVTMVAEPLRSVPV